MATKKAIAESETGALTKQFCLGCGFHLGVVCPRPFAVKNQGLWDLVETQFGELLGKGWKVSELHELAKEAERLERLVRYPVDLVDGVRPGSASKDLEANLLDERVFWHPRLQPRRMPVVSLSGDRHVEYVKEGLVGSVVPSFTLGQLADYWREKIGPLDAKSSGALAWVVEEKGVSLVLHGIDRLSADMSGERDPLKRSRVRPFDLEKYAEQIEEERGEAEKWQ